MPAFPCTTIIPTGSFLLKDFQQLCLTVNSTAGGLFGQSIITAPCSDELPALPQQTWSFEAVNHGSILVSGLSQGGAPGEIVIVQEGEDGQAITYGSTNIAFNITCVTGRPSNVVTLVDNVVGTEITLTATQAEGDGDTPPAIFETYMGSAQQIWSIEALD
ncbi:hypothetical protein MSAN_00873000 [Mycena sanguinolenta]|uniref:Uncharacterized protein n=1 Tax=Mycena sanguinolenta TaxID=230812 RepID=A0A8H6YZC3_9AGAR|nr:hypothetical protein MSAN_00873000 [Mycena sanguinolenta]